MRAKSRLRSFGNRSKRLSLVKMDSFSLVKNLLVHYHSIKPTPDATTNHSGQEPSPTIKDKKKTEAIHLFNKKTYVSIF